MGTEVDGNIKHIPRLLNMLAVAGSPSAQGVLSKFIAHQGQRVLADKVARFLTRSIEATHRVVAPTHALFQAVYSISLQFCSNAVEHSICPEAVLALGAVGRARHEARHDATPDAQRHDPVALLTKASALLRAHFTQALERDEAGARAHKKATMQIIKALEGSPAGLREQILASARSLSRYVILEVV